MVLQTMAQTKPNHEYFPKLSGAYHSRVCQGGDAVGYDTHSVSAVRTAVATSHKNWRQLFQDFFAFLRMRRTVFWLRWAVIG